MLARNLRVQKFLNAITTLGLITSVSTYMACVHRPLNVFNPFLQIYSLLQILVLVL